VKRGPGRRSPARTANALEAALLLAAGSALLASCGGKPPEITAVEWRLELRPSAAGAYESLSAFATVKDEDGIDDIERLWVLHDGDALDWSFTSADWIKKTEGADDWIGAAGLARNDYGPMPRGEYRFAASDAAGERYEKPFRVDGTFPDIPVPELRIEGDKLRVRSSWPETLILAYDGTGALIASAPSSASSSRPIEVVGIADLFGTEIGSRAVEAAAYGYDPSRRTGAYSWKTKTK
jgi:hypothetical protein